jgi:tellurium resistance protein TerD
MEITILPKGASVSIKEKAPNLKKVRVGAGWDVNEEGDQTFDLDLTAVLLNAAGKVVDSNGVVYYGNLDYKVDGANAVHHTGDNLTGEGEGDDEQIEVELEKVSASVERIAFIVNIYEAKTKGQDFSKVKSSFVRLVDADGDKEFARHDLQSEYAGKSGVLVGELYRDGGAWHFKATAEGVDGSIDEILTAKAFK